MPMLASESPANDFFGGDERAQEPEPRSQMDIPATDDSPDGGSGAGGTGDLSGSLADTGPGAALANRAADIDNPIVQGALYGLAALAAAIGGGPSATPGGADTGAEASLAESGVDGAFGDLLGSSDDPQKFVGDGGQMADQGEYTADSSNDLDSGEFEDADAGSGGDSTAETDGELDGDGGWAGDDSSGADDSSDSDGDGGDEWDGDEEGTAEEGAVTADDGSSETGGSGDSGGQDETGGDWDGDGDSSGDYEGSDGSDGDDGATAGHDVDGESAQTDARDDAASSDTDGDDSDSETESDDVSTADDNSGGDDSALEDAVPELSDTVVLATLGAIGLLVAGYLFYTRENPISTLLSIPGRLVSLALTGVIACSQAIERAIASLRGLRSIAELPGLVLATITGAFRSATTRVRTVGSSVFPFGDGAEETTDERSERHVTARERIRQAFESVIDVSSMPRGHVATATPSEVARSAREAGAPGEPVATITDSFRDVEYGDRDPDSYLERTSTAVEQLRSALEANTADDADESITDTSTTAAAEDASTADKTAENTTTEGESDE